MNATIAACGMAREAWVSRVFPGVYRPWIAEVSGVQLARMSRRGRAQYDRTRAAQWDAWEQGSRAYDAAVITEHAADAARELHPDAAEALARHKARQAEALARAAEQERREARARACSVTPESVRAGDRLRYLGQPVVAVKVNRETVAVRWPDRPEGTSFRVRMVLLSRELPEGPDAHA